MDKTKELQQTVKKYVELLGKVEKTDDLAELSTLEREGASIIQLMDLQATMAGDDLCTLARQKRIDLQRSAQRAALEVTEALKAEVATAEVPTPIEVVVEETKTEKVKLKKARKAKK